ncbi:hypothetical protein Cni_G19754 [Canna indica]|uniref:Uncharacterized protein n=1 Tax=Canna indica TaxID=4628 RepID=A0AAQ3QIX1_9LILI|nr:hypothetical protein Cni_G19754 [Canna indica]
MDGAQPFLLSNIYASTNPNTCIDFWNNFSNLDLSMYSWLLCVDFNCILFVEKKKGGLPFSLNNSVIAFRDFIHANGLIDLGFFDPPFTWSNNRQEIHKIEIRLDRVFANATLSHFLIIFRLLI